MTVLRLIDAVTILVAFALGLVVGAMIVAILAYAVNTFGLPEVL